MKTVQRSAATLLIYPLAALAAEPHEHGSAVLDVAIDASAVTFELRGAGDSFVGFEHAPSNAEERARFDAVVKQLESAVGLFDLGSADCRQTDVRVTPAHAASATSDKHHDHAHSSKAAHAEAGEVKDRHSHSADTQSKAAHAHADWSARWTLACSATEQAAELTVNLFDALPNLHELQLQLVSEQLQTGATLTSTSRTLKLTP